MGKDGYILSEEYTANLVETLLQEIKDLRNLVCKLTTQDSIRLFTEKEAANLLGISYRNLTTLRNKNKITYRLVGNSVRYTQEDIVEFEERCKRPLPKTSNLSNE